MGSPQSRCVSRACGPAGLAGVGEGELARLFDQAGLAGAEATTLTVRAGSATFEQWWQPFTLGVGPAGDYVASLSPERRQQLRERYWEVLNGGAGGPGGPVEVSATAWAVTRRG